MVTKEWKWKSHDGLDMYARSWAPEQQPKAVVCLIHGHGEHINRYNHVGEAFASAGYSMQGYDVRGHGQSEGPRGHIPSYESLFTDIRDFLMDAKKQHPGLPVFLYGHSMGGNQVINYALHYPEHLNGVIASSPWLRLAFAPTLVQATLAQLANLILPTFSQKSGLDAAAISRDPDVVRAYLADSLVHDTISARAFTVIYTNGFSALKNAETLKIPALLMHGSADRLTSAEASQEFAEKAGSLVTLRIWDGFYHELHNEPEKADVIRTITNWVGAKQAGTS